jgi:hypothetical protein
MIEQIGGRKLLAAAIVLAIALACVFLKGDVPANLLSLLQVVFATFVVGNVGEHVTDVFQTHADAKAEAASAAPATPPIDLTQAVAQLGAIHAQNEQIKDAVATSQQGLSTILQMAAPRN